MTRLLLHALFLKLQLLLVQQYVLFEEFGAQLVNDGTKLFSLGGGRWWRLRKWRPRRGRLRRRL